MVVARRTRQMKDQLPMILIGTLLIVWGFVATHYGSSPMPGGSGRDKVPVTLRTRLLLIGFGVLMVVLGIYRATQP
jgi:hypothetical protein